MAIPASRSTTYVAGITQVKSADLNDLQDAIAEGAHGQVTKRIPSIAGTPSDESLTFSAIGGYIQRSGGSGEWLIPVSVRDGDLISEVRVVLRDDTDPTTLTATFRRNSFAATTDLGSATSDGSGGNQTLVIGGLAETAGAGDFYHVRIDVASGTGTHLYYYVEVDYQRPDLA